MTAPESTPISKIAQLQSLLANFVLHCVTGAVAVLLHYTLMYLALAIGATAVVASSIGFLAGATSRFFMSYHQVFNPSRPRSSAAVHFVVSLGIQFVLNGLVLSGFLATGLAVWPAQIATTILLTIVNYAMYRLWVFA